MAADASYALQQAVQTALTTAFRPIPVYDEVPPDAAMPYVAIGDDTVLDSGTKTAAGQEFTITLHFWSNQRGKQQVKEMQGTAYAALHQQSLTVTGFAVAQIRFDFGDSFTEDLDERHTARHGVHRYRIKLTEA